MSKPTVTVTPDDGIGYSVVEVKSDEYEARIIVDADARDEDDNILSEDFCLYHMANRIAELEAERDRAREDRQQWFTRFEVARKEADDLETERDRLREQNAALAAHVMEMRKAGDSLSFCVDDSTAPEVVAWDKVVSGTSATSLTRIRAEAKAEALNDLIFAQKVNLLTEARRMRDEYRKQAEGE